MESDTEEKLNNETEGFKTKLLEERNISFKVALIAITAALYIALGYLFQPISFLGLQFRVAELIVGMCIIFPLEGLTGKVIGVFFVNLTSPLGPIDLISCIVNVPALYCIILLREKKFLKYLGGVLYAIIISIYVTIVLTIAFPQSIWWLNFVQVLTAEIILATLGILLFDIIRSRINI
ncbi:MAG: QueT transporter family protein [Candidatus Hodarchaeota archaeon]